MPFIKSDGIDFYFEVHGQGTPIIFAHGRGGSHLSWWQQVPKIAENNMVVTFDHRGFGQSPDTLGGPGRRAYASDLRNLMDHLEIPSAYLVGQSMGGWTSLSFAFENPQRALGLLLADTSAGIKEEAIFQAYRDKGEPPKNVFDRALSASFKMREPDKAFLYAQLSALNPEPSEPLMSLLLSTDGPSASDLASLRTPTLFIVGEDDIVVTPQIMRLCASYLPGAALEIVPDAGHSVYFERPEVFNEIVLRFVNRTNRDRAHQSD